MINLTFTSTTFLIILPFILLLYYLCPHKYRYIWLLFVSYLFYATLDGAFVTLLIISTIITFICGNLIYSCNSTRNKKLILSAGFILNLSILLVFKYGSFMLSLFAASALHPSEKMPIKMLSLVLPAGISFYTFQSLTYVADCYRGEVKPEKNFFKYALFVSYFPLILSGPIERSKRFLPQLEKKTVFSTDNFKQGLTMMLYGYFLKMVIVARLNILTDLVFRDYVNQSSFALIVATFAYAIQIYCDFSGYSHIAIGVSKLFGLSVINNFRQPYFATSVSDFWRRWHISLSTWFRDYLYIPLGGNRKGQIRKYFNLMIVFLVSGLWHGANLTFVFWGFLNGLYQIIEDFIKNKLNLKNTSSSDHSARSFKYYVSVALTFLLINFTWIFFRASSISEAFQIINFIACKFNYVNLIDGTIFSLGLGHANLLFVLFAIAVMFLADLRCEILDCNVTGILKNIPLVIRWFIYYGIIIMILLSFNLSTQEFIYSKF